MPRSGSFSPSLDPFGSGSGGLGRYDLGGGDVMSLAAQELYAVGVAWANGTASDDEYLAAIQKVLDMTRPAPPSGPAMRTSSATRSTASIATSSSASSTTP